MISNERLAELAEMAQHRRTQLRLSRDAAARKGDISRLTYRRVEAGESVRETTYTGIEDALDWEAGSILRFLVGGPAPAAAPAQMLVPDLTEPGEASIMSNDVFTDEQKRELIETLRAINNEHHDDELRRRRAR